MNANRSTSTETGTPDGEQFAGWPAVVELLASALPARGRLVLVDGPDRHARLLADRLASHLRGRGRPCVRLTTGACIGGDYGWPSLPAETVLVADGRRWRDHLSEQRWDLNIRVQSGPPCEDSYGGAHAVVDLHEPAGPMISHLDPLLVPEHLWRRTPTAR